MNRFRCGGVLGLVLLCLVYASPALAQEESTDPALHPALRNTVELGYVYANVRYREPGVMKETGSLHGIRLRGTYHCSAGWMGRGEMEYVGGGLDYDGQYQDGTPITRDTEDSMFHLRALVGYDIPLSDWALTPFVGLGYRYWFDEIEGDGGYEREIRYLYTPVGAELATRRGEWRFGLRGEYDLFWGGRVKSHLSQADARYNDPTNEQDAFDAWGVRAACFAEYLGEGWSVSVEPYYRYWDVEESDTATLEITGSADGTVVEPQNTMRVFGVAVMVGF
ncbi:outer membrane beta-barrel protein [Desulfobaculum sp.]|jgi:hypothetical protein